MWQGSDRCTTRRSEQQLQVLSASTAAIHLPSYATHFTKLFNPRPSEQENAKYSNI